MTRLRPPFLPAARRASLLASLLAGFLVTGCSRPGNAGESGPGGETTASSAPQAWDWTRFPQSDSLLIGEFPGIVTAVRLEAVRAPATGRLRLASGAASGGRLAGGAAWASIEEDDLPDHQREVDEQAGALADLEARYRKEGLPAELDRLDREISGAKETLALAKLAERSPDLFAGDNPALDPSLRPAVGAARAAQRLRDLEDRRRRLAAGDPSEEASELRSARTALEHARKLLEERRARANLAAPFAGILTLARDDGARVEAGEVLATIEDDSALEIRIRNRLPLLRAVAAGSLSCTVVPPGGGEASAPFSSAGVDLDGADPVPVFRFRLAKGAWTGAGPGLSGTELPVLVFTRLAGPARIVPKLELARRDTGGALADAGWSRGLSVLFPGCRVLAEGRADVAVTPP